MSKETNMQFFDYSIKNNESHSISISSSLPPNQKPKLSSAVANTNSVAILIEFFLTVVRFILFCGCYVVIIFGIPQIAKYIDCSYASIDTGNCYSPNIHLYRFFGVIRLISTALTIFISVYIFSNTYTQPIMYSDGAALSKLSELRDFYDFYGPSGNNYVLIFYSTFSFNSIFFVDEIEGGTSMFSLPKFFQSEVTMIVCILIYIIVCIILSVPAIRKNANLAEFLDSDSLKAKSTDVKSNFIKNTERVVKDDCIKALNCMFAIFLFGFVISMVVVIVFVLLSDYNMISDTKQTMLKIRCAILFVGLTRSLHYCFAVLKEPDTKYFNITYQAVMNFFEWELGNEMFVDSNINWVAFSVSLGLVSVNLILSIVITFYVGGHDRIFRKLFSFATDIFSKDQYLVILVTFMTNLGTVFLFSGFVKTHFSHETNGEVSDLIFSWCDRFSKDHESRKLLTVLFPNQSLTKLEVPIGQAINLIKDGYILTLILVVLLSYRLVNISNRLCMKIASFCLILHVVYVSQIDALNDALRTNINLGYAEMTPTFNAYDDVRVNAMIQFILFLILFSLALTSDKKMVNNKDVKVVLGSYTYITPTQEEIEFVDNESSTTVDTRAIFNKMVIHRWDLYCLLFCLLISFSAMLSNEFMSSRLKDFNYTNGTNQNFNGGNRPIEVDEGLYCLPAELDPPKKQFFDSLDGLAFKLDEFQANDDNEELIDNFDLSAFKTFADKLGFIVPILLTIIFTVFGNMLNRTENLTIIGMLLIFINFMSLLMFICITFMMNVRLRQLPFFFVEMRIENGSFYVILSYVISILLIMSFFIDRESPVSDPIN